MSWRNPFHVVPCRQPQAARPHPYYFGVFALDRKLGLDPAQAKRKAVVEAMRGHVLASGELVTKFGADNFKPPQ